MPPRERLQDVSKSCVVNDFPDETQHRSSNLKDLRISTRRTRKADVFISSRSENTSSGTGMRNMPSGKGSVMLSSKRGRGPLEEDPLGENSFVEEFVDEAPVDVDFVGDDFLPGELDTFCELPSRESGLPARIGDKTP